MTEAHIFPIHWIRKIANDGKKMLQSEPEKVCEKEKALIIGSGEYMEYEKEAQKYCKDKKNVFGVLSPQYVGACVCKDYLMMQKKHINPNVMKRLLVDKLASVVFFLAYNECTASLCENVDEVDTEAVFSYDTETVMKFGLDISSGEAHFTKLGFNVINPDDSTDVRYFDALSLAKNAVNNDIVIAREGIALDSPYLAYCMNTELCRCIRYKGEWPEKVVPIREELKKQN